MDRRYLPSLSASDAAGTHSIWQSDQAEIKMSPCWVPRVGGWVRGRTRWKIHLPWFSSSSIAQFSGGTESSDKSCRFSQISAELYSFFTFAFCTAVFSYLWANILYVPILHTRKCPQCNTKQRLIWSARMQSLYSCSHFHIFLFLLSDNLTSIKL